MSRVRIGFKSGNEVIVTTEIADRLIESLRSGGQLPVLMGDGKLELMARADSIDYMIMEVYADD